MHWTSEGITDMVFQKEKFLLSFNMKQPGIVAIFQKTYLNMPFLTWELRPTGVDSCCLNVTGNLMEVELEFKVPLVYNEFTSKNNLFFQNYP